jgi:hypothetical protein
LVFLREKSKKFCAKRDGFLTIFRYNAGKTLKGKGTLNVFA